MVPVQEKAAAAQAAATTEKGLQAANPFIKATTNELLLAARSADSEGVAVQIFDAVETLGQENYISLAADYRKFENGEIANVYVTGMSEIDNQFKDSVRDAPPTVAVVCFKMLAVENREKVVKDFINADAVFVSTVAREIKKNPNILPCFFRIEAMGEVKSKNGKYLQMKVSVLYAQAAN